VHARRGSGVFVRHVPTPYPIGRRVRFQQNLLAAGRVPDRRILHLETRTANDRECAALRLDEPADVHVYEGISLSDGFPLAFVRSVFPAIRFPDMLDALRTTRSITAAFAVHGLADYTRASTEITAKTASSTLSALLELQPGTPVLRTVSVNVDGAGVPIEFGRTWFNADRVALTLDDT